MLHAPKWADEVRPQGSFLAGAYGSLCSRLSQSASKTTSHKTVSAEASSSCSQASASERMPHQWRHCHAAANAAGEVSAAETAKARRSFFGGKRMADVLVWLAVAVGLCASSPLTTALAIALCVWAVAVQVCNYRRDRRSRSRPRPGHSA